MLLHLLLATSTALLIALPARAESKNFAVTLHYSPGRYAAQCPKEAFLHGEVARRIGYDLFVAEGSKHLTVTVSFRDNQYQVAGELRDDDGKVILTEVFSGPTCEAAILEEVTSMAAEFVRPPDPSPICPMAPEAVTCPPAPKPAAPEPAKPPAPPPAERPRAQAGLASVFSIGAAPVVVGGVAGLVGVRWGSYSLALEVSALFAPTTTVENFSPRTGWHYLVATGAGLGCYQVRWASVCARAEVRALSIGNSTARFEQAQTASFGFGPRFAGEWVVWPGLALRAYGEFLVRSRATQLRDATARTILWTGPAVSVSVGLGPVFSF